MITVSIIGLDQFVIADYSAEVTSRLANIYEIDESEILFIAPQAMVIHNGVDQTSFNVIVKVEASREFEVFEKLVYKFIVETLKKYVIHMHVKFIYHDEDNSYDFINDDYPLYITDSNTVNVDDDYSEEDIENVYTGNIFENLEEKIEEKRREQGYDEFKIDDKNK